MDSQLSKIGPARSKARAATHVEPSVGEKAMAFVKRHIRGLLVLVVVVMLVHDVFGTHGFMAMRRTQREIKKVQADLDQLDKENEQLQQQVRDLKTDPQTIERLAREGSLLGRPGEVVIKLPQPRVDEASAKSKP